MAAKYTSRVRNDRPTCALCLEAVESIVAAHERGGDDPRSRTPEFAEFMADRTERYRAAVERGERLFEPTPTPPPRPNRRAG